MLIMALTTELKSVTRTCIWEYRGFVPLKVCPTLTYSYSSVSLSKQWKIFSSLNHDKDRSNLLHRVNFECQVWTGFISFRLTFHQKKFCWSRHFPANWCIGAPPWKNIASTFVISAYAAFRLTEHKGTLTLTLDASIYIVVLTIFNFTSNPVREIPNIIARLAFSTNSFFG